MHKSEDKRTTVERSVWWAIARLATSRIPVCSKGGDAHVKRQFARIGGRFFARLIGGGEGSSLAVIVLRDWDPHPLAHVTRDETSISSLLPSLIVCLQSAGAAVWSVRLPFPGLVATSHFRCLSRRCSRVSNTQLRLSQPRVNVVHHAHGQCPALWWLVGCGRSRGLRLLRMRLARGSTPHQDASSMFANESWRYHWLATTRIPTPWEVSCHQPTCFSGYISHPKLSSVTWGCSSSLRCVLPRQLCCR